VLAMEELGGGEGGGAEGLGRREAGADEVGELLVEAEAGKDVGVGGIGAGEEGDTGVMEGGGEVQLVRETAAAGGGGAPGGHLGEQALPVGLPGGGAVRRDGGFVRRRHRRLGRRRGLCRGGSRGSRRWGGSWGTEFRRVAGGGRLGPIGSAEAGLERREG